MAKRKPKSKRPQPQHKKKKKSQHDKRKRLQRKNPNRKKTRQAKVPLTGPMREAIAMLQTCLATPNDVPPAPTVAARFPEKCYAHNSQAALPRGPDKHKLQTLVETLIALAT